MSRDGTRPLANQHGDGAYDLAAPFDRELVTLEMLEAARRAVKRVDGVLEVTTDALGAAIEAAYGAKLREVQAQIAIMVKLVEAHQQRDAEFAEVLPLLKDVVKRYAQWLDTLAAPGRADD